MMNLLWATFVAGAALYGAPEDVSAARACDLLLPQEVAGVQHASVNNQKTSEQTAKGLRFAQCFYATEDFTRSVSLTLITGQTTTAPPPARAYWQQTFHPQRNFGRKNAPRAIDQLGEAAYWTSDSRAGVLYVLVNDNIVRISVGGVADNEERLRRTTALARAVLRRLAAAG